MKKVHLQLAAGTTHSFVLGSRRASVILGSIRRAIFVLGSSRRAEHLCLGKQQEGHLRQSQEGHQLGGRQQELHLGRQEEEGLLHLWHNRRNYILASGSRNLHISSRNYFIVKISVQINALLQCKKINLA